MLSSDAQGAGARSIGGTSPPRCVIARLGRGRVAWRRGRIRPARYDDERPTGNAESGAVSVDHSSDRE